MELQKDTFDYSAVDYRDSFSDSIADPEGRIEVQDVAALFSDPGPKWVSTLFVLRNRIVKCFGLKTDAVIEDGRVRVGFFEVFQQTALTMTLGEDDKHLDFRILLSLESLPDAAKRVTVTTLVRRNNCLGGVYFFFIKPFHRLIVPEMLRRKLRELETRLASADGPAR